MLTGFCFPWQRDQNSRSICVTTLTIATICAYIAHSPFCYFFPQTHKRISRERPFIVLSYRNGLSPIAETDKIRWLWKDANLMSWTITKIPHHSLPEMPWTSAEESLPIHSKLDLKSFPLAKIKSRKKELPKIYLYICNRSI